MKKLYFLLIIILLTCSLNAQSVFINEIHYDNTGADMNEALEIAGPAGTDLTGWSVALYNGSNGTMYDNIALSGSIDDEGAGFGALSFLATDMQNGAPDGLALIDDSGMVIQFLSYEGSLTATAGPANGMTATDIGVSETSSTPIGESLQLTAGPGDEYADFTWTGPVASSFGSLNAGQMATLSVNQNEFLKFSMHPNPVSNGIVNIESASNKIVTISVFDIIGKQIISQELINNSLDVSGLNSGVYLVKLDQNGASTTKKLVIK